jgi:hypothetical protein
MKAPSYQRSLLTAPCFSSMDAYNGRRDLALEVGAVAFLEFLPRAARTGIIPSDVAPVR